MDKQERRNLAKQYKARTVTGGVYCIQCTQSGQVWLRKTTDMQGSKNRHAFSVTTKHCPEPSMLASWKQYGPEVFIFKELETLEKKEAQTAESFAEDVAALLDMWTEKHQGQ